MAARRTGEPSLNSRSRGLAVALVLSVTLVAFETTAVITALPTISDELDGDSLYGATLAAYLLANLVALVAVAEIIDRRGPRLPFVICVATFVVGLVVAAAAPAMWVVVVGRVIQGAGAGGFAPISYVVVRRAFPEERQAVMYAFLSAGWVLPSLLAPGLSGVITDGVGWRWVFLGIVPLAIVVGGFAAVAMRHVPPPPPAPRAPTRLATAVRLSVGVGAAVTGLQTAHPIVFLVLTVGGVALAAPALRALMPVGLARARVGLPAVLVCRMLATMTFLGVDSFVPLAADRIHEVSPAAQGFTIIGAALTWSIGQAIAAKNPHWRPDAAARWGFILLVIGVVTVAPVLIASWPLPATFLAWCIGGLGMGILFNPTSVAAMTYADDGKEGLISSQIHLADTLGFAVMGGIGGATVAVADRTDVALTSALAVNFALAAACALLGVAVSRGVRARSTLAVRTP